MKRLVFYGIVMLLMPLFFSCTSTRNSMQEGNYALQFKCNDFEFSDVVTGTAKETKVMGVDWKRLFRRNEAVIKGDEQAAQAGSGGVLGYTNGRAIYYGTGSAGYYGFNSLVLPAQLALSVIGNLAKSRAEELALCDLVQKNPDFDVILFPKYNKKTHWWVLGRTTTVTAKARLGVLKRDSIPQ
jgi:hypothetical protein